MARTFHISMPVCDQHHTTLILRRAGQSSWIEFRGDGLNQWADEPDLKSPAQQLHDALEGWHACVLHTGDELTVLPSHPDYEAVRELFEAAEE